MLPPPAPDTYQYQLLKQTIEEKSQDAQKLIANSQTNHELTNSIPDLQKSQELSNPIAVSHQSSAISNEAPTSVFTDGDVSLWGTDDELAIGYSHNR